MSPHIRTVRGLIRQAVDPTRSLLERHTIALRAVTLIHRKSIKLVVAAEKEAKKTHGS